MGSDEVAVGVDAPAGADGGEVVGHGPAVGALFAFVLGAGALQRHPAGVVADRADLGDLLVTQTLVGGEGGELGALVLDRARLGADLLNQRRGDRPYRRV